MTAPTVRRSTLWILGLLVLWLAVTVARLDYNSVFHDEAFHILLGRQLLAGEACPGCAYATGSVWIHPVVAATADALGGLAGARAVNVAFALGLALVVIRTTRLLFPGGHDVVAAVVFLFAGQTLYLAKLATYDMIAAFFLGASFHFLVRAEHAAKPSGRDALLLAAAVTLFLACITKYLVPVFVPFFAVYAVVRHGFRRSALLFVLPLAVLLAGYAGVLYPTREALLGTMGSSRVATQVPRAVLLDWTFRWIALPYVLAIFGCFHPTGRRRAVWLIALSLPIILLHVVTGAEQSVNKNVLLTIVLLAPAIALGVDQLARTFSLGRLGGAARDFYLGAVLAVFGSYGIHHMRWLERQYPDMTPVIEFLRTAGFDGMAVGINSSYGDAVYVYELGDRFPNAHFFYLAGGEARPYLDGTGRATADFLVFDGYYGKQHPLSDYAERLDGKYDTLREFTIDLAWGTTEARVLGRHES